MSFLDLKIHHGGVMHACPEFYYEGGEVSYYHSINTETLKFHELDIMVKRLCERPVTKYHYRVPQQCLKTGLRVCWSEALTHIIELSKLHKTYIEIYVEHGDDSEVVLEEIDVEDLKSDDDVQLEDSDSDIEDDVASLDHVSENENEEVLFFRQKKLEKKNEKKKKGKEKNVECEEEVQQEVQEDVQCEPDVQVEIDPEVQTDPDLDILKEIRQCSTTPDLDGFVSDYDDSDNGYATPQYDSEDEECDGKHKKIKWPVFDPSTKWDKQEPAKGMLFEDSHQLRHCLINYAIANGRGIKFVKMSKKVVLAKCKKGCKWRLYATSQQMDNTMQVKSYYPVHNKKACVLNFKVKILTSRWLAKEYATEIRENPRWKLEAFKKSVLEKHKINVTPLQCYRARQYGLAEVESVLIEHYARLWDYREELLRSNPGSIIVLEGIDLVPSSPPLFDKLYICFDALKKGWLAGCRPVIGLDGCFLKSFCKGQLLCAVGRDGNNHMFPIAWAVVDVESTETWTWFLQLLNKDIGFDQGHGLTFISDQQKGLLNGLNHIFPFAEHRNCARHIYANCRKHFSGVQLRNMFWRAAKSRTETEFWANMDEIKKASNAAFEYLKISKPEHWSRAFFSTMSCCDNVENNLSETFNSYILDARQKPLISMLEDVRQALMCRLNEKKEFFLKHDDNLCPRIRMKLEIAKDEFKHWEAKNNGQGGFEVRKGLEGYSVDLLSKTCTCRMWQLSGIPCAHAVSAICYANDDCDKFVYPCLLREHALKAYDFAMKPVNGQNLWPKSDKQPLLPPSKRRNPGRPKILRYREWSERKKSSSKKKKDVKVAKNPNEIVRKGRKMRCTNCNQWDHNCRNCKNPRVEGDKELDKRRNANKKKMRPATGNDEDGPVDMVTQPMNTVQDSPVEMVNTFDEGNGEGETFAPKKLRVKRGPAKKKTKVVQQLYQLTSMVEAPISSSALKPQCQDKVTEDEATIVSQPEEAPVVPTHQHGNKKKKHEVKLENLKTAEKVKLSVWKKASAAYQKLGEGVVKID